MCRTSVRRAGDQGGAAPWHAPAEVLDDDRERLIEPGHEEIEVPIQVQVVSEHGIDAVRGLYLRRVVEGPVPGVVEEPQEATGAFEDRCEVDVAISFPVDACDGECGREARSTLGRWIENSAATVKEHGDQAARTYQGSAVYRNEIDVAIPVEVRGQEVHGAPTRLERDSAGKLPPAQVLDDGNPIRLGPARLVSSKCNRDIRIAVAVEICMDERARDAFGDREAHGRLDTAPAVVEANGNAGSLAGGGRIARDDIRKAIQVEVHGFQRPGDPHRKEDGIRVESDGRRHQVAVVRNSVGVAVAVWELGGVLDTVLVAVGAFDGPARPRSGEADGCLEEPASRRTTTDRHEDSLGSRERARRPWLYIPPRLR